MVPTSLSMEPSVAVIYDQAGSRHEHFSHTMTSVSFILWAFFPMWRVPCTCSCTLTVSDAHLAIRQTNTCSRVIQ